MGDTPSDIHPESGCRLPLPRRDELDDIGKATYDQLSDPNGFSLAGLRGPGGIRLHSPRVSEYNQALNRYLRREAGFTGRVRELAILATAREMDSQFEWAAHEEEGLKEGLTPEIIDNVRYRRPVAGLGEEDAVVITLARELYGRHRVSSETFAAAHRLFGTRMLVDLVALMGNYASTAAVLTCFDAQLPDGVEPGLPVD